MVEILRLNGIEYKVTQYGRKPTMYVWASAHVADSGWSDFHAQTEFIKNLRPPIVLHEFFLDVIYNPKTGLYTKRDTGKSATEFQNRLERSSDILIETRAVKDLADELGHKVVGCDSRADQYDVVPDSERESEQADVIKRYNGTSVKPHITITGAIHCLPTSNLNRLLKREKIDYAVIQKLERELVLV